MEPLELGGAIAVALALVEVIKVAILKLINGSSDSIPRTIDGFAHEVAWRTEIGSIIKEQHELQKKVIDLIQAHDRESVEARKMLRELHEEIVE